MPFRVFVIDLSKERSELTIVLYSIMRTFLILPFADYIQLDIIH